jgi:hypothetical protein
MEFAAAAALIDKRTAIGGPAGNNGLEGLDVVFGHPFLIALEILRRILCENILDLSHGYTPVIRLSMMP